MHRIILILFILLSLGIVLNAQVKYTEANADSVTYNLYQKGDWKTLISEAENFLDSGIDFYLLKLRLGIAYYTINNYTNAINVFENIIAGNSKDTISLEYLYYAYIFSGRESDARVISECMPASVRKRLNITPPEFFNGIYTESGVAFNQDLNKRNKNNPAGQTNIYGEQNVFNNSFYYNFSLNHLINNRVSLFHSYNYIGLSSSKIFGDATGKKQFNLSANQSEYYLNAKFNLGNGFELTGAVHYINLKYEDVLYSEDTISYKITYDPIKETISDYVLLVSFGKYLGNFKLNLTNTYSQLNNARQYQSQFSSVYFPFGNLSFYLMSDLYFHTEKKPDETPLTSAIFQPGIGFKISDFLWMEANFTFGKFYNFNELNSFIVYNSPDKIKNRFGVNFILPVSGKLELSFRYQFYIQEQSVLTYNSQTIYNIQILNNNIHKLIGGIKWTF